MPRLTLIAIVLLFILVAGFGAGYFFEPAVKYTVMGLLFAFILFILDFLAIPHHKRIELRRKTGEKFSLGDENNVEIFIRNNSIFDVFGVIAENAPPAFKLGRIVFPFHLKRRQEKIFNYTVVPENRGAFEWKELSLYLRGPLGLVSRSWNLESISRVKVYPSYLQLRNVQLNARRSKIEMAGKRRQNRYGEGREFESLREYTPNDEYRKINWKATARRGKPIVSTYQIERNQSVIILIDAGRMMRTPSGKLSKLDHAVNAALMLSYVCINKEDNVGLMVFNSRVSQFLPPMRGRSQLHRINEALYNVQFEFSEPNYQEAFYYLKRKVSRRSLVVLITDVIDERASQILIREFSGLFPQHLPLFVTLKDNVLEQIAGQVPDNMDQMVEMGVAQVILEERIKAIRSLRLNGVLTLDTPPEKLTVDGINKYLEIKAKSLI